MATLVVNKLRGILDVLAVKTPGFCDRRKEMLRDLAILVGGQVISEEMGRRLDVVQVSDLGHARRVLSTTDTTIFVEGRGQPAELAATRAAVEEGLVPEGGVALPSQMACNAARQVSATYKGLWTKLKQNLAHRKTGHTKKRYKGLDQPPKYVSPTATYNYGKDYSFKKEQQVSVLTLQGRIILSYQSYHQHVTLIQQGATIGGAKLWYDKPHKQYYLLVSLELEIPDSTPETLPNVVGVDVGMCYLATTATMTNESSFYSGKRVRAQADHEARLQKRLQQKGTRSATRHKIALSGRERRLKLQTNHCIAKSIVNVHPRTLIGLEELIGIRERLLPGRTG